MDRIDILFKTSIASSGAIASYLWGEWTALLQVLVMFVIIDYLSGIMAAAVEGALASGVGFKGIAKKVAIFFMVAVANFIDQAIGDGHVFRDATISFYLANELLSIIENSGRIGLPVPEPIKRAVDVLKGKGEQ